MSDLPKLKKIRVPKEPYNSQNSPPIGPPPTGVGLTEEQRENLRKERAEMERERRTAAIKHMKILKNREERNRRISRSIETIRRKKAYMNSQRKTRRNKAARGRLSAIRENNENN